MQARFWRERIPNLVYRPFRCGISQMSQISRCAACPPSKEKQSMQACISVVFSVLGIPNLKEKDGTQGQGSETCYPSTVIAHVNTSSI